MKYLTTKLGMQWYVITDMELALMFMGIIAMVLTLALFVMLYNNYKQKKQEYYESMSDKEYRKYREHLDNL